MIVRTIKKVDRVLLFLVWPLAAFLIGFQNFFRRRADRIVLLLFSGFVGICISFSLETSDFQTYIRDFQSYKGLTLGEYISSVSDFFALNSPLTDIGNHTIYFLLSRFTMNPKLLLVTLGLIYGFFYSGVIQQISRFTRKNGLFSITLFLIMILVIFPTQGINQRFWIAGMIFLFGAYKYILYNQKLAGALLILLSPLMHIGILLLSVGFLLYVLTQRVHLYLILIMIPVSLFISSNIALVFEPSISMMGGAVAEKFANYTGDFGEQLLQSQQERSWYASLWRQFALYALFTLFLYSVIRIRKDSHSKLGEMSRFTLWIFIMMSLMTEFSMSFRYQELMIFVLAVFLYMFIQIVRIDLIFKILNVFVSPAIFLLFAIKLSAILQFLTPYFLISNYLTAWFFPDAEAIWSYIDFLNV